MNEILNLQLSALRSECLGHLRTFFFTQSPFMRWHQKEAIRGIKKSTVKAIRIICLVLTARCQDFGLKGSEEIASAKDQKSSN